MATIFGDKERLVRQPETFLTIVLDFEAFNLVSCSLLFFLQVVLRSEGSETIV